MRQNPMTERAPAEQVAKDIRRATCKLHSSEEKTRFVPFGLRGDEVKAQSRMEVSECRSEESNGFRQVTSFAALYRAIWMSQFASCHRQRPGVGIPLCA
jgi:hypothetical protein